MNDFESDGSEKFDEEPFDLDMNTDFEGKVDGNFSNLSYNSHVVKHDFKQDTFNYANYFNQKTLQKKDWFCSIVYESCILNLHCRQLG